MVISTSEWIYLSKHLQIICGFLCYFGWCFLGDMNLSDPANIFRGKELYV